MNDKIVNHLNGKTGRLPNVDLKNGGQPTKMEL